MASPIGPSLTGSQEEQGGNASDSDSDSNPDLTEMIGNTVFLQPSLSDFGCAFDNPWGCS
ncbi:MAG: hypothetical protein HN411_05835 [Waddliaceae bacterium]|jgi:hypothetical protein|nr:hypothetical protein [Waddliaceae bacterium]MBT3578527.1 hypothetical protein [Waddliaceae bacterium]MBT4445330.1 hypothetical protein [Waddliaceae bacterium]MBT6928070.1 hypothetical protein [Waddliaceae bacterium]MBT7264186.1 hypothetical protein [Waddliaceae bacterium]